MNSVDMVARDWRRLRSDDSRMVETALRQQFETVDAYRFNPASLRVRVIDSKFRGLSREQRHNLVEPWLETLPRETEADIMNLVLLYPGETEDSSRAFLFNEEFEHPAESLLS